MTIKRELEEDLKLTDTGEAFINTTKSNIGKVAIIGGSGGRTSITTLAKMMVDNEDIKIEIKGDLE